MVASRDGELGLVGDGAPFELRVLGEANGNGAVDAVGDPAPGQRPPAGTPPEGFRSREMRAPSPLDVLENTFGL
jgi:hypothetical protein